MSTLPQVAIRLRSCGKATCETGPWCASRRPSIAPVPACQKKTSPLACTEQRCEPWAPAQATCVALLGRVGSSIVRSPRASLLPCPPGTRPLKSSRANAAGRLLKLLLHAMKRRWRTCARLVPGAHSTQRTTPGICTSASCRAEAASHRSTRLSAPHVRRRMPSGLTEQAHTAPRWPSYHLRYSPSGQLHAMTSLSFPHVKSTLPVGSSVTKVTGRECFCSTMSSLRFWQGFFHVGGGGAQAAVSSAPGVPLASAPSPGDAPRPGGPRAPRSTCGMASWLRPGRDNFPMMASTSSLLGMPSRP
mmetsp:Transcript_48622/g.155305  ORF Transcript_48622/g.155305 Transcript_48622/m.155305 type:complete len:303 (-) Transcript_48622:631-1539(-)